MRQAAVLLTAVVLARAEPPAAVLDLLRTAAEALADQDVDAFLDHFDRGMTGYSKLRDEIQELATTDVSSTIEIVKDDGDQQKRELELDWLLKIGSATPRREIVKCRVERQGRKWKITAFEPVEFFAVSK